MEDAVMLIGAAVLLVGQIVCMFSKKVWVRLLPLMVIGVLALVCFGLYALSGFTNWGYMILLILLASQLHGSAILMLPIIFIVQGKAWNIKTMVLLAVTIVAVVFIDRFTPVLNDMLQDTQYDDIMTNEIWMADDGTNILRVAVYSIPALLSLVGLPYVRAANNQMINVCVNCSIMTMALYIVSAVTSGIYIGRLPIYTTFPGYIALPWLIDHIFEEKSAKLMRVAMYMAYIAFFYYQTGILWGAF